MLKFKNAKKFNRTSIKKLPEEKPILYKLLNNTRKELYIGVAKRNRIQDRLLEHLTLKEEKIPGATKIKFVQFSSIKKAKKAEKQLIKKIQPRFNEQNK